MVDRLLWAGAGLSASATLVFSLLVTPPTGGGAVSDDVLHGGAYLVTCLCLLLAAVWRPGRGDGVWPSRGVALGAALLAAGALLELGQGAFTTRQPQVSDVVADAVGIAVALGVHGLLRVGGRSG